MYHKRTEMINKSGGTEFITSIISSYFKSMYKELLQINKKNKIK